MLEIKTIKFYIEFLIVSLSVCPDLTFVFSSSPGTKTLGLTFCRNLVIVRPKAHQSLQMKVTRRKKNMVRHYVAAVVGIIVLMNFGLAATSVRGGSMGSVLR